MLDAAGSFKQVYVWLRHPHKLDLGWLEEDETRSGDKEATQVFKQHVDRSTWAETI